MLTSILLTQKSPFLVKIGSQNFGATLQCLVFNSEKLSKHLSHVFALWFAT
jgi:hypothetical protein